MTKPSFGSTLSDDFARKALWATLTWLLSSFIAPVVVGFGGSYLASRVAWLAPYRIPIIACVSFLTLWLIVFGYAKWRFLRPAFRPVDVDYEVLNREIIYKRHSSGKIEYLRHFKLRALRDGLDRYSDRYHWTGDPNSASAPRTTIHGQRAVLTVKRSVWQLYEVWFEKTLKRGEQIDVAVQWTLDDSARSAVPFISATIEEPTDHIRMVVELPEDLNIQQVTCEISPSLSAKKPIRSETQKANNHGQFVLEHDHPDLLHHYEIRWSYD